VCCSVLQCVVVCCSVVRLDSSQLHGSTFCSCNPIYRSQSNVVNSRMERVTSCHAWISSCHTGMRSCHTWVMSRIHESCHTWSWCHTRIYHVTHGWVVSRVPCVFDKGTLVPMWRSWLIHMRSSWLIHLPMWRSWLIHVTHSFPCGGRDSFTRGVLLVWVRASFIYFGIFQDTNTAPTTDCALLTHAHVCITHAHV